MMYLKRDQSLVGTAELRKELPKFTKELKIKKTMIILNRGKPVAVLEDFSEFEEKEHLLETFEDLVLGYLAKERDKKSKAKDYLDEETAAKKLKIRL